MSASIGSPETVVSEPAIPTEGDSAVIGDPPVEYLLVWAENHSAGRRLDGGFASHTGC
jgi:hypothetical protein